MDLMTNKYLNFPSIDIFNNTDRVRNTTNLTLLPDIPEKFKGENYILRLKIEDDRLIESISFELYESTNYWDLLLILNGIRSLSHLPINYDIVQKRAVNELAKWMESGKALISTVINDQYAEVLENIEQGIIISVNKNINLPTEVVKRKYLTILDKEEEKNERYRYLKYISLSDMSELERDLLVISESPKIDKNIIVT